MPKLDFSLTELITFRLQSTSFEVLDEEHLFEGGNLKFECQLTLSKSSDKQEGEPLRGDCDVIIEATKLDDESSPLFKMAYEYVSFYEVTNSDLFESLDDKQRADYCLEKIYPIIRDDIMKCLDRAGLRQINLPYNFKTSE